MPEQHQVGINVKATEVLNNGNGTFTILIPATELPTEVHQMVGDVLPDLFEGFYKLVNQQSLLNSLAKPHEVNAPDKYGDKGSPTPIPPKKKF